MKLEPAEIKAIITRLKRANGHRASVIRMLEEGARVPTIAQELKPLA